jgi:hypothetical protein
VEGEMDMVSRERDYDAMNQVERCDIEIHVEAAAKVVTDGVDCYVEYMRCCRARGVCVGQKRWLLPAQTNNERSVA